MLDDPLRHAPPPRWVHTAFFRFAHLPHPAAVAKRVREWAKADLVGSVLVAHEGINGTLAGPLEAVQAFEESLRSDAALAGAFAELPFKRSGCTTPPFARLAVHVKPRIVALRLPGEPDPTGGGPPPVVDETTRVSPTQWRELIRQPDVVVLDNRNAFEYRLGHFKGAVNPGVGHFRDFPAYVLAHADRWRASRTRVAMYCTGGIRCERSSHWMQRLGLEVHQLDGGILNHFQSLPDAERDFRGECFVFDNRISLDTRLHETSTTADQVFAGEPDRDWRLARARRLLAAVSPSSIAP